VNYCPLFSVHCSVNLFKLMFPDKIWVALKDLTVVKKDLTIFKKTKMQLTKKTESQEICLEDCVL